ncbi:MAG TPA: hypothetical protein ENN58_02890, partial [bacterium]|nr:hypothetical protein [bacterium]
MIYCGSFGGMIPGYKVMEEKTGNKFLIYSSNPHLADSVARYLNNTMNSGTGEPSDDFIFEPLSDKNEYSHVNSNVRNKGKLTKKFKDHLGAFFPEYLINNYDERVDDIIKSCAYQPRIFTDSFLDDLKKSLESTSEICKCYLDFYQNINDLFRQEYKIIWNDFSLNNKSKDKKKLYLYNIQSGTEDVWKILYNKFFNIASIQNIFFLFYYFTLPRNNNRHSTNKETLRINKETLENEDKLFGYSRFLRDFLKAKGIGYEIQINQETVDLDDKIMIIKRKIEDREGTKINAVEYFDKRNKSINETLRKIYGPKFNLGTFQLIIPKLY